MKNNILIRTLCLLAFVALLNVSAFAKGGPLGNADVAKLIGAGMPEEIVLKVIASSETAFDTSPEALIALKSAGASSAVLSAVVGVNVPSKAPASQAAATSPATVTKPVVVSTGGAEIALNYTTPTARMKQRAFGYGGSAAYAILPGVRAANRLDSNQPTFLVTIPEQANPNSYILLVSMEVRKNGVRELKIGGGTMMSVNSDMDEDAVHAVTITKAAAQTAGPGFVTYQVQPAEPLVPGEYALILNSGETRVGELGSVNTTHAYFDFGI